MVPQLEVLVLVLLFLDEKYINVFLIIWISANAF